MPVPHDAYAERAVLGACLVNGSALSTAVSELDATDFYSEQHRGLFSAIVSAAKDHDRIDHVVLGPYLPADGWVDSSKLRELLFSLVESVPTSSNTNRYAANVKAASRARQTLGVVETLRDRCLSEEYEGAPEMALSELEAITRDTTGADEVEPLTDALDDVANWLHESRTHQGVTGIRTGIPKLDAAVKGLNPKRLYIIGARPGQGKSLISGQIALTAARNGYRVLLQSPEMGRSEYLRRLAVAQSGMDAEKVQDGRISAEEERAIFKAAVNISEKPLTIDDFGTQTLGRIRRNVIRYQPDLLIVDYLQRLMPDDRRSSRYDQVSQMSFDLDRIKKDFSIPVVAAAQLNRNVESRNDKHPMLSDLRDSGTVEQDADAVVMLHKPSVYDDSAPADVLEIGVEKNRHGPLFDTRVYLDKGLWVVAGRGMAA